VRSAQDASKRIGGLSDASLEALVGVEILGICQLGRVLPPHRMNDLQERLLRGPAHLHPSEVVGEFVEPLHRPRRAPDQCIEHLGLGHRLAVPVRASEDLAQHRLVVGLHDVDGDAILSDAPADLVRDPLDLPTRGEALDQPRVEVYRVQQPPGRKPGPADLVPTRGESKRLLLEIEVDEELVDHIVVPAQGVGQRGDALLPIDDEPRIIAGIGLEPPPAEHQLLRLTPALPQQEAPDRVPAIDAVEQVSDVVRAPA
jgi:hypothetical protein